MIKRIIALALALLMVFTVCACGKKDTGVKKVEISVKGYGEIELELYPEIAPITVENFINLVNDKFYDGLTFHRIITNFMIQGGDPNGDGTGGSPDKIKGEFSANGVENTLSHERGVISMARRGDSFDSASSQFFICHKDAKSLDGQYAAFGKVTAGMEIVDTLATTIPFQSGSGAVAPQDQPIIEYIKVIE